MSNELAEAEGRSWAAAVVDSFRGAEVTPGPPRSLGWLRRIPMPIGVSHGGANVYASEVRSDELLVGTRNGVVLLERAGSQWEVKHRALNGLHISAIAPVPESDTVFAGAF